VVFGLCRSRVTKAGVFTGLVTDIALVAYLVLSKQDPFLGIDAGFFALYVNFVPAALVRLTTSREPARFQQDPPFSPIR
jgi:hypothetical protein